MSRPHIRPSRMQQARSNGKEPEVIPCSCPVLGTYEAVIHGQLVKITRYGKPTAFSLPLPRRLFSKVPVESYAIDPDWIAS